MFKKTINIFFILILPFVFYSQDVKKEPTVLKRDFRGVVLLENYETVIEKLKKDNLILLPSTDFDLMDEDDRKTIIAKIPPYIERIYYQFEDDKLFIISIFFDNKKFSYLEVYKKLKEKYGNPVLYNSLQAIWEDEKTKIVLDNLPSIKYIDKDILNKTVSGERENENKDKIKRSIIDEF
ncbi:MAG TPA: hypothetical protein PKW55_00180 [Spirochaetota bacterium]|nr:hypothetical protein [Spirochaetota bacterium]HOM37775.1 hypothetical protein [Spirochaetota bacterium]HPQ49348.1 hypothetical protein [Spirochaetota bacterium]